MLFLGIGRMVWSISMKRTSFKANNFFMSADKVFGLVFSMVMSAVFSLIGRNMRMTLSDLSRLFKKFIDLSSPEN